MNESVQIITDNTSLDQAFENCCKKYDHIQMFVAWIGNPFNTIPFNCLRNLKSVRVTVGISFCQSHPDGIEYLMALDSKLRIVNENPLFHPKVYIFSKGKSKAILIGSSNFTYSGFYENIETNLLIEGKEHKKLIEKNEVIFQKWNADDRSFLATNDWLVSYRIRYSKRQKSLKKAKLKDESIKENDYALASSWLNKSGWNAYVKKIMSAINKRYDEDDREVLNGKIEKLNLYKKELPLPWKLSYFADIDKRRMMGGLPPYAWLGHVAASGFVRKLLANGTTKQKEKIISCIDKIGSLKLPIDWQVLEKELIILESLGPTIKVWGRFLTITRPDLFCTFSAPTLRHNLAEILEVPKSSLETIEGYIQFLKMVHGSPWFNSPKPNKKQEIGLWENRVAFLDEVFY